MYRLIPRFKTSQTEQQIITIHTLPNISRSKCNQVIKFNRLTEYNVKIFFFKNHAENEAERIVTDFFCFLKKLFIT